MSRQQKKHTSSHSQKNRHSNLTDEGHIKRLGVIKTWHDDKGFGFIESDQNESHFFHISEYKPSKRPTLGEPVVYKVGNDTQGRIQAKNVQEQAFVQKMHRQTAHQQRFMTQQKNHLFLVVGLYVVLTILSVFGELPIWMLGWYALLGVLTFAIYAKDKNAAKNKKWRTPESTLHLLAVAGGWGGAILAQTFLRHKSQKIEFRRLFYITILINLAILMGYLFKIEG